MRVCLLTIDVVTILTGGTDGSSGVEHLVFVFRLSGLIGIGPRRAEALNELRPIRMRPGTASNRAASVRASALFSTAVHPP